MPSARTAKSTGILFFIEDIAGRFDPEVVRYYLLSTHYRSPIEFSEERENFFRDLAWWLDRYGGERYGPADAN